MMIKGKEKFSSPTYVDPADCNALGQIIGRSEDAVDMMATIYLGHVSVMPPEDGIVSLGMIATGIPQKGGAISKTGWIMEGPAVGNTPGPKITVSSKRSFDQFLAQGYTLVEETTVDVKVGVH